MLSVKLTEELPNLQDYRAFVVYHQSRTIAELTRHRKSFSGFNLLPKQRATLIFLGLSKGKLLFHKGLLPAINNQVIWIKPKPSNFDALAKALHQMNY